MVSRSCAVSFLLPGGICPVATVSYSGLLSGLPGITPVPPSPPLTSALCVRRSRPPRRLIPWQDTHDRSTIGSTSFSYVSALVGGSFVFFGGGGGSFCF